ncbi:MAG: TonB family protein [Pyrinomonadaceae bacterium]|nr:TonB family protein [Pyrinomonadaceae bacterium]
MTRGVELYKRGENEGAIKLLRAATKKQKSNAEAWYFLGAALVKQGEVKDAGKSFEAAVKLRPQYAVAHTGLAYTLLLRNKLPDSQREAAQALSLNPQDAEAHYVLGVVKLREGKSTEAVKASESAIKAKPELAAPYLLKSQALLRVNAERLLTLINEKRPLATPPDEAARKERSSVETQSYKEAAESLDTYLKLKPQDDSVNTWREQLETLRVYAKSADVPETDRIFDSTAGNSQRATITGRPEPQYTERARKAGVEGEVVLRLVLASDGTVKHILVVQSLSHGLTEMAVAAAHKIKFTPATKDGRPVSQYATVIYNFNLY